MKDSFDVLIVGAGIVGCACARDFAAAGLRVAIVEAGEPAGATTSAGMGHIVVMDDSPAQLALTAFSRLLWRQQADTLPAEAEYRSRGTLWVASDADEWNEAEMKHCRLATAGINAYLLSEDELRSCEPNLRKGLAGGLLVPDDGVNFPPASARHFLAEATRLGAHLFPERATHAREGKVLLVDGTTITAERIVLATGTDCTLLPALPLRRRKGHLIITRPVSDFVKHQVVELGYIKGANDAKADSVAFNIQPRSNGQLWVGASRQYGNEDPGTDDAMIKQVWARALAYMPALGGVAIDRSWAGFRAATADKLPLIGPASGLSDDPTLWLAAGFEGLGITCSLGAARLLRDCMLGQKTEIDPTPYLPLRLRGQMSPEEKQ